MTTMKLERLTFTSQGEGLVSRTQYGVRMPDGTEIWPPSISDNGMRTVIEVPGVGKVVTHKATSSNEARHYDETFVEQATPKYRESLKAAGIPDVSGLEIVHIERTISIVVGEARVVQRG